MGTAAEYIDVSSVGSMSIRIMSPAISSFARKWSPAATSEPTNSTTSASASACLLASCRSEQPSDRGWESGNIPLPALLARTGAPMRSAMSVSGLRVPTAPPPTRISGGGAVGTRKPLTDIAERIGAPVLASNAGKGILPDSHPLSLGCSVLQEASKQALADADVVLLVGSEVAAGDHFLAKLEIAGDIIRIDIDPTELTSMYSAAVPIQADARAAMLALSSALARCKPAAQRSQGESRVDRKST